MLIKILPLKSRLFITLIIMALAPASRVFAQPLAKAKLDSIMDFIQNHHLAMGSVAIAKNGRFIYSRTLGFADQPPGNSQAIPLDTAAQYAIGSVTKMFTAVMVLQLVEQGKLTLQTPLSRFFPKIPLADRITIQMLLGHRSGLPDYINDPIESFATDSCLSLYGYDQQKVLSAVQWMQAPVTKDSILRLIIQSKRHFSPGTQIGYNNSGYWLLAAIMEKVTGRSYADNLRTRIIEKSGLLHTEPWSAKADSKVASKACLKALPAKGLGTGPGTTFIYCEGWQPVKDLYLPNVQGAGDLLSTATDLTRFMQALFDGRLINEKSLGFMRDFYDKDSSRLHQFGFGLESAYFDGPQPRVAEGHSGDTYYSHSSVFYFPDLHLSICCLRNGNNPVFDRNDLLGILYDAAVGAPVNYPGVDLYEMTQAQLLPLVGNYYSDQLKLSVTVTMDCHTLIISPKGQTPFITFCEDAYTVSNPSLGITCKFNKEGSRMVLTQHGKSFDFLRQSKDSKVTKLN